MRLGILGGTFDPIHFGHLRLAEEVGEELELERVYLVPAAAPPHKERKPIAPFPHRFAMAQIATRESPLLHVHDLEGRREGLSYSIETLREFRHLYGTNLQLFFILGMDALLEIKTWKDYQRLFDHAHFVVIQRPGFPSKNLEPFLRSLGVGFRREGEGKAFIAPSGNRLIYMAATLMKISSTEIREKVVAGKSIRFLLPEGVRMYIRENGLYRTYGAS